MLNFIDVAQNSDEWMQLRSGKITSSKLGVIMAENREYLVVALGKEGFGIADIKSKKIFKERFTNKVEAESHLLRIQSRDLTKSFGDLAKKYAVNIAIEQITGQKLDSNYSNDHMARGHEQEPIARMLYEDETFCDVENGGFFYSDNVGCSPDGLVNDDGVIEIKSVIHTTHFDNLKRQKIDPAYKWQCVGNLMFTGRKWLDFISYCADFLEEKQLFICRIYRKDLLREFRAIESRIAQFNMFIQQTKNLILNNKYSI